MLINQKNDFTIVNEFKWNSFKNGYHILINENGVKGRMTIKLTEEDYLDEKTLEFMTLNGITR